MSREMKDSGVEWIGQIPEGWKVSKFKFHTKAKNEKNPGNATILSLYREHGIVIKDSVMITIIELHWIHLRTDMLRLMIL